MNGKGKRPLTWGPIVQERVRKFFQELLLLAAHEKQNEDIQMNWEDENNLKPTLIVESKRRFLQKITDLTQESFYEAINQLKELGILEDRRGLRTRGAEDWHFALKLWSRETEENLREFERAWEKRKPKGKGEAKPNSTPVSQGFESLPTDFDIEREPQESQCLETILRPGSLLRIKGPQQMGKKRLLNRVLAKVKQDRQDSCQIVILNWQVEFDSTVFNTYAQFLENFCAAISKHLGLPDKIDQYWNRKGSPNNKTTGYFSDYLLPQSGSQLILVLEAMDLVFNYDSIAEDFCGLLRGWHLKSGRDKLWHKLSLVILHSTDKYASLDIKVSPLCNLGETVTIEEFTRREVDDLVKKYGLLLTSGQVEELMAMVEGHPFLINQALKQMTKHSIKLEEILANAATSEGIYHAHLLELWHILEDKPPLKEAFKKVVTGSAPLTLNPDILFKLESLGLVRINKNCALPRCLLYRQYFTNHL